MKQLYFVFLLIFFCNSVRAQQWIMVWNDEFNFSGLPNPDKWGYDSGGNGFGNNEEQYYTESREENARVENGKLILEARLEEYSGRNYTSSRLVTRNKGDWKYGRVEVRAKLPSGRGIWPAIWMLPTNSTYGSWPESGEIDIMEYVGFEKERVHFGVHTGAFNHSIGTNKGASTLLDAPEENFYNYTIEWYPDSILFMVDDIVYFNFKKEGDSPEVWPFDKEFYLILNVAVGGDWGGLHGIDNSIFPQQMEVEYVRVYEWQEHSGPFAIHTETIGDGSVTIEPALELFDDQTTVSLKAVPDVGNKFVGWLGDVLGQDNPHELSIRKDIHVVAEFLSEAELVLNGNFNRSLSQWVAAKGSPENSISTERGKACLNIIDPGANPWDISLAQRDIHLEQGKFYEVEFTVNVSSSGIISGGTGAAEDPWTTYTYKSFNLNPGENIISYSFQMNNPTNEGARIMFDLGGYTGDICFTSVSLRDQCVETIIPYFQKNGGELEKASSVSVTEGESLSLKPEAVVEGSWRWSGPDDFSADQREIFWESISMENAGTYTVTFTNLCNNSTSLNFFVNVNRAVDCNGVEGGSAEIDECGICAGGNTGLQPVYDPDNCQPTGTLLKKENDFLIYPVPAQDHINIRLSSELAFPGLVKIFNNQGVLINSFNIKQQDFVINLAGYVPGLYIILMENDKGITQKSFMKL